MVLFIVLLPLLGQAVEERPIPFRSHKVGELSGAAWKEPQVIVAREEKDLRRIEGLIGGKLALDDKALKDEVFLWVFSGQRPSTGYELLIVRAVRKERLRLEVRDIPPQAS